MFIKPINNEEGILVHRLDKSKKYIHSLSELDIGYIYLTEKETPLIRQNQDEVILANKIIIQCKSLKRFSIKGILQHDITTLALENFTKRKVAQGMLFIEEDGQLCRIFYRVNDLVLNTVYANHDDTVLLQRLPNGEVRFRFEGQHSKDQVEMAMLAFQNPSSAKDWKRILVLREHQHHSSQSSVSESIATKFLSKFQTKSKEEMNALKAKRENTIKKLKSRMRIDWEWKNADDIESDKENSAPSSPNIINSMVNKVKEKISKTSTGSDSSASSSPSTTSTPSSPSLESSTPTLETTVIIPTLEITETPTANAEATIDAPIGAPPAPPPPPPPPGPPPPPPFQGRGAKKVVNKKETSKKMRPLHWNIIPKDKLKETFWDSLSPVKSSERDQSLVESWFSLSPPPKVDPAKTGAKPKAVQSVAILDLRRANNACILLSQFKLSFTAIKEAILIYDDNKLSVEQLIALDAMMPITDEESIALAGYAGPAASLAPAERFFLEVMGIDRLHPRIQTFLFRAEAANLVQTLDTSVVAIQAAIEQVRRSTKFIAMLKVILHVGSILNRGTYLHGAGFRLDSLAKLSETKSKDQKHTVIDFVEKYVRDNKPELLNFYEELDLLGRVATMSLEALADDAEDLTQRFKCVSTELEYHTQTPSDNTIDNYVSTMQPFYDTNMQQFTLVVSRLRDTQRQFTECCAYFGEDSSITSKDFFSNITKFSQSFQKVVTSKKSTTSSSSSATTPLGNITNKTI
eukprot:gene7340-8546_t